MGTRFAYEGKGLKVLWQKTLTLEIYELGFEVNDRS